MATTDSGIPIRVLGPVEVTSRSGPAQLGGPKQRALFAMLTSRPGRVVTNDELIEGIWGDDPPKAVQASVHTYVSNLRAGLDHQIERRGDGYLLDADPNHVDAAVFEESLEAGRRDLVANPTAAGEGLRGALALWRGRPYADVADFPGLREEARRLSELRLTAVEARIEADLALGRHSAVIGELEALAGEHPFRESLRAKQMLALYRDGRQAEALRAFRRTQEYLRDELGIDPSPELQELESRILDHDYTLIHSRDVISEQLALLFTDIVNSSILWEAKPETMREALARHDDLVQSAIEAAGGTVVKGLGDGFIAAFSEPALAARAAVTAQREVLSQDWADLDLGVRMVVDSGELERRGGDLFGPPMNRGSRLLGAAHGGQILLSREASRRVAREQGTQIKSLGEHRFKGLGEPQEVYQLVADGLPADFPDLHTSPTAIELDRSFGDAIRGYELRERIGKGAFATVYRGYQPSIGREVAIKVVKPEFANHPAFIRRFEAEARFVASLEHPHLVSVYDYWRDADGAYVVAPYLAGRSLADAAFETMSADQVVKMATQVGSALSYAHRQGMLHRDIKPANILLDRDGNAYLADFGIAARAVEAATGVASASAGYRAPEDQRGGAVDARSDIYSLAAVVARFLTGGEPPTFDLDRLDPGLSHALERGLAPDPGDRPETVDQFLELLSSSVGAKPAARPATSFRNPYKGLAAFEEKDAPDFFGRTEEVRRLVAMVSEHRLSAVVGPSGSGKSSVTLAGLLPTLDQGAIAGSEKWVRVRSIPGGYPFDELATALGSISTQTMSDLVTDLAAPDGKGLLRVTKRIGQDLDAEVVLVIDQFEELFTLVASDDDRDLFMTALVTAASDPQSRTRIVLTLRADFFHDALSHPALGPVISMAHLALALLDPDGTRQAIEEPAARAGLELEAGVADRMIADLTDQPGTLPLLQFTLDRLARGSEDGRITNDQYDALGGVAGALGERAEAAYRSLTGTQQEAAGQIFTRLLTVRDDADDVRRRVRVSELKSLGFGQSDIDIVLDTFGKERLLTFDVDPTTRGATVEVAHEALLREWSTLRRWVDSRRESLVLQRRFQSALAEWEDSGRDPDHLLTRGRLNQYEEWASDEDVTLTVAEQEFLDASIARTAAEAAQRRTRRRRIMGGFAAAAVIASILAVAALFQQREAERNAALAEARQIILEAKAAVSSDPELGMLLGLAAIDAFRAAGTEPPPSAVGALREAVGASVVDQRLPGGRFVAVSSDGSFLATKGEDETVAVWDTSDWELIQTLDRSGASPGGAFFHTNSGRLFVIYHGVPQPISVWDWSSSAPSHTDFGGEQEKFSAISLAIDLQVDHQRGLFMMIPGDVTAGPIEVWSIDGPEHLFTLESLNPETGQLLGGSFSADGRIAFVDVPDAADLQNWLIRIASAVDGEDLQTVAPDAFPVPQFTAFADDGSHLLIVHTGGMVGLVDLEGEELIWSNDEFARLWQPFWLPDGEHFVAGGEGSPFVINASDGVPVRELVGGVRGGVVSMAPIPGTDLVATAGFSSPETVVFDLALSRSDFAPVPSEFSSIRNMAFVGEDVLQVSDEGSNALIDARSGGLLEHREGVPFEQQLAWGWPVTSTNGHFTGGSLLGGGFVVWSNLDRRVVYTAPEGWYVRGVSEDGSLAVIVLEEDASTRLVRTNDGTVVAALDVGGTQMPEATFSPDGSMVVTFNNRPLDPPSMRIWSTSDGSLLRGVEGDVVDTSGMFFRFSPEGARLVVGGVQGTVFVLDVAKLLDGAPTEETIIREIPAHGGFITSPLKISPDGSTLITKSHDEPIKAWDLETSEKLGDLGVSFPLRLGAAFHPTRPWVYVALPDNRIGIYTLDVDELMDVARSRLTRGLTDEECQTYLQRETC